jgi:hypothetical protein
MVDDEVVQRDGEVMGSKIKKRLHIYFPNFFLFEFLVLISKLTLPT